MALIFTADLAVFRDTVDVEDAETLLEWMQEHPRGLLDCAGCSHLHAAHLQVLMAAGMPVSVWPQDEELKSWLEGALAK